MVTLIFTILVCLSTLIASNLQNQERPRPYTDELVTRRGYPIETHVITTVTGYNLVAHRIPHGKFNSSSRGKRRTPVIVQHGIMQSSAHWVLMEGNNSLGFVLADEGYDVWLTNLRGNDFSNTHTKLSNRSSAYWNFSFDEMGYEDLTTTIDYILHKTNSSSLYYIGYSMGTTVYLSGLSLRPNYNKKIKLCILMAPVAYLSYAKTALASYARIPSTVIVHELIQDILGTSRIVGSNLNDITRNFRSICKPVPYIRSICEMAIYFLDGPGNYQYDPDESAKVFEYNLDGIISSKTFIHYEQIAVSNIFQRYDYHWKNIEKYGQFTPPFYPLTKLTAPIAIFWSSNDWFCDPRDLSKLVSSLPNLISNYRVPDDEFAHLDFVYGSDAFELVYTPILNLLKGYDKQKHKPRENEIRGSKYE